ncbi:hypothetical protein [Nocardioides sp.]|uniref:hypothetical protein n=1 Tax=Nocardioides sp. TaxID=35761 RepID=UPI0025E3A2AF|nr:hypothetical protein [Nocardioides sp.]
MRKTLPSLADLALVATGALTTIGATTSTASAATACVTKAEYKKAKKGMTKTKIDHMFGTKGHREAGATSGGYRSEVWSYRPCTQYSAVSLAFSGRSGGPLTMDAKSTVWSY